MRDFTKVGLIPELADIEDGQDEQGDDIEITSEHIHAAWVRLFSGDGSSPFVDTAIQFKGWYVSDVICFTNIKGFLYYQWNLLRK